MVDAALAKKGLTRTLIAINGLGAIINGAVAYALSQMRTGDVVVTATPLIMLVIFSILCLVCAVSLFFVKRWHGFINYAVISLIALVVNIIYGIANIIPVVNAVLAVAEVAGPVGLYLLLKKMNRQAR